MVALSGKRDDADDLRTGLGGRFEAVAADHVVADPDRAHRGAMLVDVPEASLSVRLRWMRIQLWRPM